MRPDQQDIDDQAKHNPYASDNQRCRAFRWKNAAGEGQDQGEDQHHHGNAGPDRRRVLDLAGQHLGALFLGQPHALGHTT